MRLSWPFRSGHGAAETKSIDRTPRPDAQPRDGGVPPRGRRQFTYKAFISYSRAVDSKLAPALRDGLHRFAKPWYRTRPFKVFRDDASLSANPNLWSSIESALDQSEFFILVASPESAGSKWVQRELGHWLQAGSVDRLLIALTDGKIMWDRELGDFDWDRTTAIPPVLAGRYSDQPRHVSFRFARGEDDLSLSHTTFRDRIADLAAPLHRRSKDDLVGEDVRQHRRAVRLAKSAVALLTTLAVLATGSAVVAAQQRQVADQQRQRAIEQRDIATSRQLAAEAEVKSGTDPQLAALLSAAAFDVKDTDEARVGMLRQLDNFERADQYLRAASGMVRGVAFSPDRHILASSVDGVGVVLWDTGSRERLATLADPGEPVAGMVAFNRDGTVLAVGITGGVALWDVARRTLITTLKVPSTPGQAGPGPSGLAFSPDGQTLATSANFTQLILWNVATRSRIATLSTVYADSPTVVRTEGRVMAFSPDGATIAVESGPDVLLWDVGRRTLNDTLKGVHTRGIFSMAFSPDGRTLATGGHDDLIVLWNVAARTPVATMTGHESDVNGLAFTPAGTTLVSASEDKHVILWDATTHSQQLVMTGHTAGVSSVAVSPDGRWLASGDDGGNVILRNIDPQPALSINMMAGMRSPVYSHDGRTLAMHDVASKQVVLWNTARHAPSGTLPGAGDPIAFSPDDKTLVTSGSNNGLAFWDVSRRTSIASWQGVGHVVAFSRDWRLVASGSADSNLVTVWSVSQHQQVATLDDHTGRGGIVTGLAALSGDNSAERAEFGPR